jgi:hypothetical protein
MEQRQPNLVVRVTSMLFVILLVQVIVSFVWPGWFAVRHDDATYNVISVGGRLVLQRAHLAYPPIKQGWSFARGGCLDAEYGPEVSSSPFEDFGLVDTVIRIPWEVNGLFEHASTIRATGRSVCLPLWLLLALTCYPPLRRLMRRWRLARQTSRL